jgi:uncharacterized membrane protein
MSISFLGLISTFTCLIGFFIAYLYGRKTKKFYWSEYIAIVVWPLFVVVMLSRAIDQKIMYLFVASMLIGTIFEYFFGFVYEKVLNKKLWKYSRLSIHGYTSILSIPLWGIAGVVFWSLGKIIGL